MTDLRIWLLEMLVPDFLAELLALRSRVDLLERKSRIDSERIMTLIGVSADKRLPFAEVRNGVFRVPEQEFSKAALKLIAEEVAANPLAYRMPRLFMAALVDKYLIAYLPLLGMWVTLDEIPPVKEDLQ